MTRDSELALNLRADASLLVDMFNGKPPPQTGAIIDRLRDAASRLEAIGEPVAWRCAKCNCHSFARVDELQADGHYKPGSKVRCINCKDVSFYPEAAPPSGHVAVPVERVERQVTELYDMEQVFTPAQRRATALSLAELYANLAALIPTKPEADVDARDAQRWRALMSSARMHFMGSAGFDIDGPKSEESGHVVARTATATPRLGEQLHFGMEFWSEFTWGSAEEREKYPDTFERDFMEKYVDEIIRRKEKSL